MKWGWPHEPNNYKDTKPYISAFLKSLPLKGPGSRFLSVWGPLGWKSNFVGLESGQTQSVKLLYMLSTQSDPSPPFLHTPVLTIFTQERGGGGEPVRRLEPRGELVHKRSRKYQHDWLYLLPINSPVKTTFRFGVFIVIRPLVALQKNIYC